MPGVSSVGVGGGGGGGAVKLTEVMAGSLVAPERPLPEQPVGTPAPAAIS